MPTVSPGLAGWTGPEHITDVVYDFARLVIDPAGHAHVAAARRDGIFYLTNATGSWTRERLTTVAGDRYDGEPSIVVLDDGSLAIAFARFDRLECFLSCFPVGSRGIHLMIKRSGAWSEAVRAAGEGSQQPSLEVVGGAFHLAYSRGERNATVIHHASDAGGQWASREIGDGRDPSLQVGSDGLARIAYVDGRRLFVATQASGSNSFEAERVPGEWVPSAPLLGLDARDEPQIVFFNDIDQLDPACGALFVRRAAGAWSDAAEVFGDVFCSPIAESLDTDDAGVVHVVSLYDESGNGVWYANNAAGAFRSWQLREPKMLTDDGPRGVSALDVDTNGRPHVLFRVLEAGAYDEDTQGEPEDDGLWYGIGPGD